LALDVIVDAGDVIREKIHAASILFLQSAHGRLDLFADCSQRRIKLDKDRLLQGRCFKHYALGGVGWCCGT
jgi:hypothetical protein